MFLERSLAVLPQEVRDKIEKSARLPQNFFKHASHDADESIDFAPGMTEWSLFDAMAKCIELTGEQTLMMRAYEICFGIRHPELFDHTPLRDLIRQTKKELGTVNRIGFLSQFIASGVALRGVAPNPLNAPAVNLAPRSRRR